MSDLFNTIWDAPLNSTITSNTIVANFGDGTPVAITSGSGTLFKNDVSQGNATTVDDGDTLRIEVVSDSNHLTASYIVISVGTILHAFSCVTIDDNTPTLYPPFKELLPLDLSSYQDGSTWTPSTSGNHLTQYSPNGTVASTVSIVDVGQSVPTTDDFLVVANYFNNTITKVSPSGTTLKHLAVGIKPYGFAYTPNSLSDKTALLWVTLSGENKVVCIDVNDQIVATYPTGVRPMAIASCADGRHVYVANYQAGTITHFSFDGTVWNPTTVTIGQFPFAMVVENNGNAWITCAKNNLLYKVTKGNVVTSYPIGGGLRGLAIDPTGASLWIAASLDSKVYNFSLTSNTVIGSVTVDELPYDVNIGPNGTVHVYGLAQRRMQRIVNGVVNSTYTPDPVDFGSTIATNGNLWMANYYANAPTYVTVPDHTPDAYQFTPALGLAPNEVVQSSVVFVTGFTGSVQVSVAPMYGALLVVNGSVTPSPAYVVSGNTVQVQFRAPAQNQVNFNIPVIIGATTASIVGSTRANMNIPDTVYFDTPINVVVRSIQQSSEVTISGLTDDVSVPVHISHSEWRFVFNGTLMPDDTIIEMKNGDKFAIVGPAYGSYSSTLEFSVYATVDEIAYQFGVFRLKTKVLDGPTHVVEHNYSQEMLYIKRVYPTTKFNIGQYVKRVYPTIGFKAITGFRHEYKIAGFGPAATFLRASAPTAGAMGTSWIKQPNTPLTGVAAVGIRNAVSTPLVSDESQYIRLPVPTRNLGPVYGYETSATIKLVLSPERDFIRNGVTSLVLTAENIYDKGIPLTIIEVDPVYDRNTVVIQRTIVPVFDKEASSVRRTVAPIFERNKPTVQHTETKPIPEKYVVWDFSTKTFRQTAVKYGNNSSYPAPIPKYVKYGMLLMPSVAPAYIKGTQGSRNYIDGPTNISYEKSDFGVKLPAPAAFIQPTRVRRSVATSVALKKPNNPITYSLPAALKAYHVNNVVYVDTSDQQGSYATAAAAIAAGEALGYLIVNATKLPNGFYMWNTPGKLLTEPCGEQFPEPGDIIKPYKWYMHGG